MRLTLKSGFYEARSLIADAQRCLNLYPEINANDSEVPITHYPVPGKTLLGTAPGNSGNRGEYTATNGKLYVASGDKLFYVSELFVFTEIASLSSEDGPVYMKDNGTTMVVVDGSSTGIRVTIDTNVVSYITSATDANWRPAGRIDYADGYFICNVPNTRQWFVSDVQSATFSNPLYFASKEGNSDLLVSIIVVHREIWLIGRDTAEVYFNSGSLDFPFQRMPGVFIQHGCAAGASIATWDLSLFWLGRDPQGQYMVLQGSGYQALRISTHAIEEKISTYSVVSDAIGYCYQQEGHPFYVLTFPIANATWVFDMAENKWHERGSMDSNGVINRDIGNCHAFAYGKNIVGDYSNGNLYALDQGNFTENGNPIFCLRSFPTIDIEDKRIIYKKLTLDMQTGVGFSDGTIPTVNVRWSDDGGNTWGNAVQVSLGAIGDFKSRATLWRMGYGRRRVYEVSWSFPIDTAINGAWLDYEVAGS